MFSDNNLKYAHGTSSRGEPNRTEIKMVNSLRLRKSLGWFLLLEALSVVR